jgi:hypothetical protein
LEYVAGGRSVGIDDGASPDLWPRNSFLLIYTHSILCTLRIANKLRICHVLSLRIGITLAHLNDGRVIFVTISNSICFLDNRGQQDFLETHLVIFGASEACNNGINLTCRLATINK